MAGTVKLKHTVWNEGEKTFYFYDGELVAHDGVLEIPADKPEWIKRAWIMGYRLDVKGKPIDSLDNLVSTEGEQDEPKKSANRRGRTKS